MRVFGIARQAGVQSYAEADEAFTRATAAATNLYRRQRTDEHTEVWLGDATTRA